MKQIWVNGVAFEIVSSEVSSHVLYKTRSREQYFKQRDMKSDEHVFGLAVRVYPKEKAFRCSSCSQSCSCVSVDRCRKMRKVVSVRKGEKDERREQTSITSNKQM